MTHGAALTFRRNTRIRGFDYRENHAYFVTLCVTDRRSVFGSIRDGVMHRSQRGNIAADCWQSLPAHHPQVELDAFVVMPNHVHGIICIVGNNVVATPASRSPQRGDIKLPPRGPTSGSLSAVVGSFKSAVSREINNRRPGAAASLWQLNFYDHIVRDERSFQAIRDYIESNPARWPHDEHNDAGDRADRLETFTAQLAANEDSRLCRERDAGVATTSIKDNSRTTNHT